MTERGIRWLSRLTSRHPGLKRWLMVGVDIVLLFFSVWLAFALRLGEWFVPNQKQLSMMLLAPLLALPIFLKLGLYRSVIRYVEEHALWSIFKALSLAVVLWVALIFMGEMSGAGGVPRTVPLLYWLIGGYLVGGVRFAIRWLVWLPTRRRFSGRQVLIYGANEAGRQLAASLRRGNEMFPAGFIDDDPRLQGSDMEGLRIYPPDQLPWLIEHFGIRDVTVTLPKVAALRRREILAFLEQHPVRVQVLPALADLAKGYPLAGVLRDADMGDLLGRDPVLPDQQLLRRCITGKVVLVSGAGGSIGSELCRQVLLLDPARLILLDANEHALYQIDRKLRRTGLQVDLVPVLGSIEDERLLHDLFAREQIETVYHAAAHKHVPLVEANLLEGVGNNFFGTLVFARAAMAAGVSTFVLISSDKAVRPTNVMGATKRWAELVIQDCALSIAARGTSQHFCAVRFGNVLGSSGSVIPLFREQIARGGPITVTHPEVVRYFMSIHEAVELVIQAGSLSQGGEIFLLDMGEPVKILDLAKNMIRLSGHTLRDRDNPDGDIDIEIVGLRPGEKLFEELLIVAGNAQGTQHPKIMRAGDPGLPPGELDHHAETLRQGVAARDQERVRALLMRKAGGVA